MHTLINTFRWLFGSFFCLVALGGFANGDTGFAFSLLLVGLVCLPPVSKAIFRRKQTRNHVPSNSNSALPFKTIKASRIEEKPRTKNTYEPPANVKTPVKTAYFGNDSINHTTNKEKVDYAGQVNLTPPPNHPSVEQTRQEQQLKQVRDIIKALEIISKPLPVQDDSIIDVTGKDYKINVPVQNTARPEPAGRVPYWSHQYVYSYSDIYSATPEQLNFYKRFKEAFLSGTYLDLEGNTNYAFILLFDLLDNEYEKHRDLVRLENELNDLGFHYPKTNSYATSFLIKKMEASGDYAGVVRLRVNSYQSTYQNNYDYWGLGNKYKTILSLTDKEVALLNKLWNPGNNFCNIEFCLLEVLKLYLATIKEIESICAAGGTTLSDELNIVSDIIARKYFKYRKNSANYTYNLASTTNELYALVFKHCENAVREHYGHKRKISTEITYNTNPEVAAALEEKLTSKIKDIHPKLLSSVSPPDATTEIELNIRNTSRWKAQFDEITAKFKESDGKVFIKDIQALGVVNQKNPALENIYFEASKFITKIDPEAALILYLHYLYYDLQSVTFNNKQLAKTVQKSLFKTQEQLLGFEIIVKNLLEDRDLVKAIQAVSHLFAPKRKRIQLNTDVIKEVQQQHSSTVELLNGYLQDKEETTILEIKDEPANTEEEEISFQNLVLEQKASNDFFVDGLTLDHTQRDLLQLFFNNDFSVPKREVESFSKANGLMRNQLIDSINDCCQDQLDDVLIEEDDEHYTIYDNYFQKLIKK